MDERSHDPRRRSGGPHRARPDSPARRPGADRDRVRSTSCARCSSSGCSGRCGTPTTTCRTTGRRSTRPACTRTTSTTLGDLARFPFTTKADLRENYPFGMFAVPARATSRASTPRPAPPASRPSSATPATTSTCGPTVVARSIRAAGGRARDDRAQRVRLRPVHRRARRALRRRGAGLHGRPGLRRHDRAPGAADPRLRARHHHGHAVLHARRSSTRWSARASTRASTSLQGRHLRRRAVDRGHAPRDRAAHWTCTRSTSTGCPR